MLNPTAIPTPLRFCYVRGMAKKPRKPRHDGWNENRRKNLDEKLRQTGCVRDACRVTGMSDTSAYLLRQRDAAFCAAWDEALADARRGLVAVAHESVVVGKEIVIIRNGKEVERRIMPSDSMLALLIKQGDLGGKVGGRTADKILTLEEWEAGHRFGPDGAKYIEPPVSDIRQRLDERLSQMRRRLQASGSRHIDIHTGEGITREVHDAVLRHGVQPEGEWGSTL